MPQNSKEHWESNCSMLFPLIERKYDAVKVSRSVEENVEQTFPMAPCGPQQRGFSIRLTRKVKVIQISGF